MLVAWLWLVDKLVFLFYRVVCGAPMQEPVLALQWTCFGRSRWLQASPRCAAIRPWHVLSYIPTQQALNPSQAPGHQAACFAALCSTATALVGLLPPTLQPAHIDTLHAARQLLQAAVFFAPSSAERATASVHLAACWGLEGWWEVAAEHVSSAGAVQGDVATLLRLHAGCWRQGAPPCTPLPLSVLRCAMHTLQINHARSQVGGQLPPRLALEALHLLMAGFSSTPELQQARLPAAQHLLLWRALMLLTITAAGHDTPHDCEKQLLQEAARVALTCSKWAVKTHGPDTCCDALRDAALSTYECGLLALRRDAPRAAVTLLTAAAAAYGLGGGHQDAACKKTALVLALEAALSLDTYGNISDKQRAMIYVLLESL